MALTAYSHLKSMRVWKGLAFLFAFIFVSAATTMIFVGIIVYSPKFILLYLTYPLCAIIALMAGRKDDE